MPMPIVLFLPLCLQNVAFEREEVYGDQEWIFLSSTLKEFPIVPKFSVPIA